MTPGITIGVVGNPNCGKTTLFNALTGAKQRVGNWPGVTVERKTGRFRLGAADVELVDLPGTYSLDVGGADVSLDEQIARDFVATREADLILNIVDASNLERNLYLTTQLLEMRLPMVVAVNMVDMAKANGLRIDFAALAERLGCPVFPVVASAGKGIEALKKGLVEQAGKGAVASPDLALAAPLARAVDALMPHIGPLAQARGVDPAWAALSLLESDNLLAGAGMPDLSARLEKMRADIEAELDEDIDIALADGRYGFIAGVMGAAVKNTRRISENLSDRIDRVVLSRWFGMPVFFFVMYLMFLFTINIGGAFIDFFDMATGALVVDGFGAVLDGWGAPVWLREILAGGIGSGIQVVATFIPIIAFLFCFLSILEDSGYMSRAAFVMDRAMRAVGLPGKAFVPLIVGFGCTVPAVMATRTMEQYRDRILTIIMAPFMSCGARLPVYALFAAVFFTSGGQWVVFGLYLIGIAVAVLTGLVMKSTLLQGPPTPFLMELPAYHIPTLRGIALLTWEKTRGFVLRAGRVIVPMVMVLNVLNSLGTDGSYGHSDSRESVLSQIGRGITPAFAPMGMREDNWPAAVGIFTGVLAKEAVVGTLDALYEGVASTDGAEADEEAPFDLGTALGEAVATIPANLSDALGGWADPLGFGGEAEGAQGSADTPTGQAMQARFDGAAGAFAYLLFILLYFPCTAALAAIYREAGGGWTVFVAGWTTAVAYIVSTLFYQIARFNAAPSHAAGWIAAMVVLLVVMLMGLRQWTHRRTAQIATLAE